MIYNLKGTIIDFEEGFLVLDVNNVGYQVFAPSRIIAKAQVGEALEMPIYTHVREDQITLFGFSNIDERKMYLKLLSVNGVGPKMGMAVLAVCTAEDVVQAVNSGTPNILQAASGVGKKVAERIILDLAGKLPNLSAGIDPVGAKAGAKSNMNSLAINDVISALSNMGFKTMQANQAVSQAVQATQSNEDFGLLLKESLRILKG
ncbi:MAG: Holliday junction branch migration protein RuvA [Proteobacteria bacterium]|nr:Holliday junction branch migration protein RuvA [Pseudomonadota bacterium]